MVSIIWCININSMVILTLYQFAYKKLCWWSLPDSYTLLALFFIDLITTGGNGSFLRTSGRICAYISAGIIYVLYKNTHLHGLNILASAFIVYRVFAFLTEMILDEFLTGLLIFNGTFCAVSVLPVAMIFFFYITGLKKGTSLIAFFHIWYNGLTVEW